MVLGRNDKRKRKEGDLVDLMDPLSESPKRTKVHAQRKFAQGAATVFSPAPPLVKEKEKTKAPVVTELITHKRPNTEDFLTFLCFRGTSILPPSLNFFNVGTRKEKTDCRGNGGSKTGTKISSSTSSGTNGSGGGGGGGGGGSSGKGESSGTHRTKVGGGGGGGGGGGSKSSTALKKKVVGNGGVPTTLSKYKNATSTVQALKKKYQEQRLAKQRIKNKLKASCVMRTRSSRDRTLDKSVGKMSPRKLVGGADKKRRDGLRSGGFGEKSVKAIIPRNKVTRSLASRTRKRLSAKEESSESEDSETASSEDEEEDEEEEEEEDQEEGEEEEEEEEEESRRKNLAVIRKTGTSAKTIPKKICTRSKSEMRRITRSQRESPTNKQAASGVSRRPTRKTKEAAAVYMEILGRKLVSPELDNEDDISLESFPELPNARRTARAENEMRAKTKAVKNNKETKRKEEAKKEENIASRTRTKPEKVILKSSKRTLRVRRYCELDSEDDSETSVEPEKPKESIAPRRTNQVKIIEKASPRSLRSSSRNQSAKTETKINVNEIKRMKEKLVKRRGKVGVEKTKVEKEKSEESEEEESLGNLLNKMTTKKKEDKCVKSAKKVEPTERKVIKCDEGSENRKPREKQSRIASQVSDDEESFRGFTKKAISKVLNSCNSHASANLLASEEAVATAAAAVASSSSCNLELSRETSKIDIGTKSSEKSLEKLVIDDSSREYRGISSVKSSQDATIVAETKLETKCIHATSNDEAVATTAASAASASAAAINLMEMPLSGVHGRKSRVNMSTEQIEKWLNDSSMAREKSRQISDTETSNNFHQFDPPPTKIKSESTHLSIPTRIQHLVRPVNVTIPKLVEKSARERSNNNRNKIITNLVELERFSSLTAAKQLNIPAPNRNKINADMKEIIKGRSVVVKGSREIPAIPAISAIPAIPSTGEESDGVSKSDQNSVDGSSPEKKSTPEKKPIFQQRKTFLPKVKERKTTIPSANAFSPENESSVYAFESDTEIPINTPFRRKLKEQANKPSNCEESTAEAAAAAAEAAMVVVNSLVKLRDGVSAATGTTSLEAETKNSKISCSTETLEKFVVPKSFGNLSQVQVLPLDKMPATEWSGVGGNCGASIAVQVNFDEQSRQQQQQQQQQQREQEGEGEGEETEEVGKEDKVEVVGVGQQKCTEISTQTENTIENENEEDGHVFYIPLQSVGRNGPNLVQGQQLIQGVAVKLGTEGPNGPNQRVLLRAQLVTKPPMSVARCPPVGTVQPTTRNPPNSSSSTTSVLDHPYAVLDPSQPSTSTNTNAAADLTTTTTTPPLSQTHNAPAACTATRLACHLLTTASDKPTTKSPKSARERKASVDSTKTAKRVTAKSRQKMSEILSPSNATIFPGSSCNSNAEARLVEAPTFHPTEKDFQDPLEYIDKIRSIAEKFGICRVVPPANFKPECKVSDDMRFTAYNQYVHRMLHRWGPNVKEMMAIKKYLATQSITLTHPPWIGGMEVDLPHLYQTVQSLGGLKEVIEKKKWQKVADGMKIPKSAQDRVTKLDDIYCKYLLPYDTLSPEERGNLFDDVEEDWKRRETKTMQRLDSQSTENDDDEDDESSDEIDECIIKGRNMPLNAFYRIARNTQRMWFGENQRPASEAEGASAIEVEAAFWKHVAERKRHVCVHAASIDSSGRGFGFSVAKNSPFARHPWNLKVLTNNAGSVLRALGPLMGVTVPTLHVGMLFSACCWYRDPHGLPWIEYLHTGAKKIWYGIPDEHNNNFREALSKMVPRYCKKKTIWLPSDTAMVPPELLVNNGVPLCRTVQEPGQFIVVFPKAFTSSICTGYVVSESVYFAQPAWLENAEQVFKDLQDSCEPSIFSFERLLFSIINDTRSQYDVLKQIMPVVIKIREREHEYRKQLEYMGLTEKEKLPLPGTGKGKKGKKIKEEDGDFECETCRANLFVSLVNNSQDDSMYCLPHAIQMIVRKKQVLKNCTLMYTYTEDELDDLIHKLEDRIEAKSKKPNQIRQSK